jgi:hypothetical protein
VMTSVVTLWRPTGSKELALVKQSGWKDWPPRFADQPMFYPVTNRQYSEQIARDWNTKFDDQVGHVTRFDVRKVYLDAFEKKSLVADCTKNSRYRPSSLVNLTPISSA